MKIVFEKDCININDILSEKHIVIAKNKQFSYILRKDYKTGIYEWLMFATNFTNGDYLLNNFSSIEDAIKQLFDLGYEVEAFKNENWRKALKWAIT